MFDHSIYADKAVFGILYTPWHWSTEDCFVWTYGVVQHAFAAIFLERRLNGHLAIECTQSLNLEAHYVSCQRICHIHLTAHLEKHRHRLPALARTARERITGLLIGIECALKTSLPPVAL